MCGLQEHHMLLSGHSFTTTAEQEIVCDIEEKLRSVTWTWSRSWPRSLQLLPSEEL